MKIATLLLNQGRGSGEVARQQVRHLLAAGHPQYFMHPGIGDGVAGATNIDIELHTDITPVHEYLPAAKGNQKAVSTMTAAEAEAYLPAYERALASVIEDVDIVIGHHANLSAVATHRVASRAGKPYVLFLHGTGIEPRHQGHFDDQVWSWIETAIVGAAGVMVTTDYVRDELVVPMVELPAARFLVLPCGVDLDQFRADQVEGIHDKYDLPDRYVICPGALTRSKGPQNVVAASEHYAEQAQTLFIGAGDLRASLERELGGRGRFLGFVSDEDKAKLINAATLLVAAPDKKEHFGIIYAEALAAGTPPVAYQGGGVGSIVTPEVGVLTQRNPIALGRAIADLLARDDVRAEMALAGRRRAERNFAYPILTQRLEGWLLKLSA